MKELIQQYGGVILGMIGAGAMTALFLAILGGPLSEMLAQWGSRFL